MNLDKPGSDKFNNAITWIIFRFLMFVVILTITYSYLLEISASFFYSKKIYYLLLYLLKMYTAMYAEVAQLGVA